ncbi:uncharacterized protein LOC127862917 isoform X2 [Dreissena polymorpha]|uniref:uncharacterized protein LOC127862917 isoform X2 n=1 Tax=Dreissena polymorpha TaxID=45954 RepID=UPI0022653076|nr:uncharacterized protein LOC127862917 isoform X2 [Dreissena polymorpha]
MLISTANQPLGISAIPSPDIKNGQLIGSSKHPSATFDALLATAAEEHKFLQEEQKQPYTEDPLFKSFEIKNQFTNKKVQKRNLSQGQVPYGSPKRPRLESISPSASPNSASMSSKSKTCSLSSISSSGSRSRSPSSSPSSQSNSTSGESGNDSKEKLLKYKTLPTQPMLPAKMIPWSGYDLANGVQQYTLHVLNPNLMKTVQVNKVGCSTAIQSVNPADKTSNSVLSNQKSVIGRITNSSKRNNHSDFTSVYAHSLVTPVSSSKQTSVSNLDQKSPNNKQANVIKVLPKSLVGSQTTTCTVYAQSQGTGNQTQQSAVKYITGLPGQNISTQPGTHHTLPMAIISQSNGVAQLLTFTSASLAGTAGTNSEKITLPSAVSEQISAVNIVPSIKQAVNMTIANNISKYNNLLNSNASLIAPISQSHSYSDSGKQCGSIKSINSNQGLQLSVFQQHLVPMPFRNQNMGSHSSLHNQITANVHSFGSQCEQPSAVIPRPSHSGTPIPRIVTPAPGSATGSVLSDLTMDHRGQIGSQLLIQPNLSQLQNPVTLNAAGQFNTGFHGNHRGLTLVGLHPDQSGDHAIRLQSYQGLASQRLAMYSDQAAAMQPTFHSIYRPGGELL